MACKFQKLSHGNFIERQLDLKRQISTIYRVPLLMTSNFQLDWLHVVDLGVTPDCLGNCFHCFLPRLGKHASGQLAQLLLLIKQYYIVHDIQDGINNLTAGMIRASPSVSPKLKLKGGEARSLVGFAKELVEKRCDESQAFDSGVKWVVIYLNQCHDFGLHRDSFHAPSFQRAVQSFLLQYKSLEEAMGTDQFLWVLKPKFHTMEALAPYNLAPRTSNLGPRTSHLGPRTSNLGPRTSHLGPRTSDLEPRTSDLEPRPRTSDLGPRTSDLEPRTSDLELRTSNLGPRTSDLGPRTSDLEPRTSDLELRTSNLGPRTSNLGPRTSDLEPRTSDLEPRTSNLGPRTSNLGPRTSYLEPRTSFIFQERLGIIFGVCVCVCASFAQAPMHGFHPSPA